MFLMRFEGSKNNNLHFSPFFILWIAANTPKTLARQLNGEMNHETVIPVQRIVAIWFVVDLHLLSLFMQ